jgi:hypothetical protein
MSTEQTTTDRIPKLSPNGEKQLPITLDYGVTARLDEQVIRLTQEEVELFRFPSQACPFDRQPLSFLLQIYMLGYGKGRTIGKELAKARIRELLGAEL